MDRHLPVATALACLSLGFPAAAKETDLCAGKAPGTVTFYDQEISRDAPLPEPVTQLKFSGPMFALLCLADAVGPQAEGGKAFRVVLYVKQTDAGDRYTAWKDGKQAGSVFRPQLSKKRKDIIVALGEDFGDSLPHLLDAGTYGFRLQAATEKGTGKLDVTVDVKNKVAYLQELRKAGYVADGSVTVVKE